MLGDTIDASLSAAELKVKQKRQEELARMRLAVTCLVSVYVSVLSADVASVLYVAWL